MQFELERKGRGRRHAGCNLGTARKQHAIMMQGGLKKKKKKVERQTIDLAFAGAKSLPLFFSLFLLHLDLPKLLHRDGRTFKEIEAK